MIDEIKEGGLNDNNFIKNDGTHDSISSDGKLFKL